MTTFSEFTKKKKKQDIAGMSFNDYTRSILGDSFVENDIAPVRTTVGNIDDEEEKKKDKEEAGKLDFFQKGVFEDGYNFGDVTKTILGTVGDAGVGIVKGAGSLVEGVVDAGRYGVAGISDKLGNETYADKVREKAKKNSVENFFKGTDEYLNEYSVLGRTSDAILQGVGQVGGIIGAGAIAGAVGVGMAGATALTTGLMGVSSAGSGMSEAYQGGATDEEATKYGISKGVIDAGTELLFGGLGKTLNAVGLSKGISSLDDVFAQKLSSKLTNQVAKNFVEFGVKASAEGFEEVLAGLGSAVAKKLTYMEEEELNDILKDENLLEQFVVGTVTSGMIQSGYIPKTAEGSLKEANKTGRDFITGYTQNEQAVIDKEVEKRVGDQKLSKKELGKIEEQVKKDLEKGYIDIDTIESALGGETYNQYKSINEQEEALTKQLEELKNAPNTVGNAKLYEETENKLAELKKNSNKTEIKEQLSKEVQELTKSDLIIESYNEKGRRSQKYEADLTKYDEKQQAVIQKAVESGILNNTNRTHEFVDMVARLSADKGVSFDFINNTKLKESGFAIEGKTVNGYVKDGNIAVNIDSNKALNTVVGHEITHVLEGTELYTELQNVVKEYATTKGEYDTRYKALEELYKDVDGAVIENELTADLVGEYLFTDSDFINNLSTTKPNVFKKIYNEIKYLYKLATAGSKEARQLEKVKKAFDKAYKEGAKNSRESSAQYTLSEDTELYNYIQDALNNNLPKKSYYKISDTISDRMANDIENIVGFSVKGYGNEISPSNIRHINKRHGENGKNDTSMKDSHDLAKISYVIDNYDNIREGKISTEYRNSDGSYAKTVELQKKIDDGFYYVVEAVPDSAKKTLHIVSAYINKKDTFSDVLVSNDPKRYVQDEHRPNVSSNYIIPENTENSSGRKNAEYSLSKDNLNKVTSDGLTMTYVRVPNKNTPNYGRTFGQNIEPAGEYMNMDEAKGKYKIDGYEYGTIQFKKPLVLEHINTSDTGWKKTVSDMYNGLTGKKLTKALIKDGYDAIVTYDEYGYNEIVNLNGKKLNDSYSLSGEQSVAPTGNYHVYGKDIALETPENDENITEIPVNGEKISESAPKNAVFDDYAPLTEEEANERDAMQGDRLYDVNDLYMPEEAEAPYYEETAETTEAVSPFEEKDIQDVGNRKQKAYMYENPEVKPYFQAEANVMLGELRNSVKGEKHFNDQLYYDSNGEQGWYGTKRETSEQIAYMLDRFKYTYADIEKGLRAIIEDHGAENNAVSKRLEFMLDERLREGYTDFASGYEIPSNQEYINLLNEKQITEYSDEAYNRYLESLAYAEAPEVEAPVDEVQVLYSLEAQQQEKIAELDSVVEADEPDTLELTVDEKYDKKLTNYKTALEGYKTAKTTIETAFDEAINKKMAEYNALKRKDTQKASNLLMQIENLKLRKNNNVTSIDSKIARVETRIDNMVKNEAKIKASDKLEMKKQRINNRFEQDKQRLREEYDIKEAKALEELKDRNSFISKKAFDLYKELTELRKGVKASKELGYLLDFGYSWSDLKTALLNTRAKPDRMVNRNSGIESIVREAIGRDHDSRLEDVSFQIREEYQKEVKELERERDTALENLKKTKRVDYHRSIVDNIKNTFAKKGFDFDKVLENAKSKGTFSSVDNTPQRFIEKSLGYKEGQILNDLTINKVAQNETKGIQWLNSFTDKRNGLLAQISKEYGIKPRSKESASAQMYAEGFWVDDNGNFITYGDEELAKDYPNVKVRENIKKLAKDERIRKIYDETLEMINDSRKRNLYPEIPRRNNYFLHFREMEDTFSKLGIPFNPNDIRLKDLPTDINGVTADLKPGQPYFASAKQRLGYKTTYDLVGGVERYLNSAKNQIYHIDDIQTLRALRNYIADTYGQAKGLESLDSMTEEEAVARIQEVYNSHLSTFAKFLNEEANILAGKTSLTDRGLEGVIGRRGIQFLDTVNRQVGSNMVGANISSALTNTVSMVQSIAKSNKFDSTKAFAQTVRNQLGSLVGKTDGFVENNPMMIRRKGIEKMTKTPWESITDKGYLLMSAIDNISSEFIVRTKFNELTRKGMSEQQAHIEADKWASRILGDRSLGQQPQLYNSKMLGLITKFQLEVRNQLDSQFYDTIQDAKVSNEEIENRLLRNMKTSAKVGSTFFQLAVLQHLFGQAFESVAGYNPAFDIVEALSQMLGFDDDEESEDTVLDNLEEGFLTLLGDLPYTSTFTGGRIPISSALPVKQFITGKDSYGNEKSRWETIKETAPYYLAPTGYGQFKKTTQGLEMFNEEHPVAGSYTKSGNLRFPVEDTPLNRLQAGIFGQYASENARDYFDNERSPLKEKQIQEYKDLDIPIRDYWEYREGLAEQDKLEDKFDYIAGLDLPVEKKNIMINNIVDRKDDVDMTGYDDFADYEEFDFATKNEEKYEYLQSIGVSYDEYTKSKESKEAYDWAFKNPEKYTLSKVVTDDVTMYRQYTKEINEIEGVKDANGKTKSGSRKENVLNYINNLDADYYSKIILFKSEYKADDTYNEEIINYLNSRSDITYEEEVEILKGLGFTVEVDGTIRW